jgi:hypothetical protein
MDGYPQGMRDVTDWLRGERARARRMTPLAIRCPLPLVA